MERVNENLVREFAKLLKQRRKMAGLSQEELAFRADLSVSYISLLETSNRQPTLTVLHALCEQLDVSLVDFFQQLEDCLAGADRKI
ncbi:helix-turn-helix domain-containing protein [Pseudaestuariivita rosea]|uniref:helix-turn-helix domain-containing protein n=1 Tax=Pseudaestuariivita rosea TaxID=2763263 RepID=UPI001ABB488C|nr:helix-turn-helix transcriptional regulator [Pseudaestuariivita rosea]